MKILRNCALAGITFWAILFTSCKHEPELMLGIDPVCFGEQVQPIISTSCAMKGCHTGDGELFGLKTYPDISSHVTPFKPMASRLHKVLLGNPNSQGFMPPKNKATLSSAQIDIISLWILQGAQDCKPLPCDPNVTYTKTILPIITNYCQSCHGGVNPQGGISLTDYKTISDAVNGDRFMGAIEWLDTFKPMPKDNDKLSDCKISQFLTWKNDGTPQN